MGGDMPTFLSLGFAAVTYIQSGSVLGIKQVPIKLLFGVGGYFIGLSVGCYQFGNRNHYVYYTQQERDILAKRLPLGFIKKLHVIDDKTNEIE